MAVSRRSSPGTVALRRRRSSTLPCLRSSAILCLTTHVFENRYSTFHLGFDVSSTTGGLPQPWTVARRSPSRSLSPRCRPSRDRDRRRTPPTTASASCTGTCGALGACATGRSSDSVIRYSTSTHGGIGSASVRPRPLISHFSSNVTETEARMDILPRAIDWRSSPPDPRVSWITFCAIPPPYRPKPHPDQLEKYQAPPPPP